MTIQTPEEFIHTLIEHYDNRPADKPMIITLTDVSSLANAEAVLKSRADEIDDLNRMLDQKADKLAKLEERYIMQTEVVNDLSKALQDARNDLINKEHSTELHEVIWVKLNEAEWALRVLLRVTELEWNTGPMERALNEVFGELRAKLTIDNSGIPF